MIAIIHVNEYYVEWECSSLYFHTFYIKKNITGMSSQPFSN